MTESLSPWQLPAADLQWSADDEPFSNAFGDIYFSRGDGLAETEYVFVTQNHLQERWRKLDPDQPGVFVIGETGFGTGLNFFCAWRLWREIAPASWRLLYISAEKFPLDRDTLQHALAQWPQFSELGDRLLAHYPPRVRGFHARDIDHNVTLQLLFGDATEQFQALHDSAAAELPNHFSVDAWFLDGFAPAKNPEMWSPALFEQIGRLSKPGTSFATFTVAGIVKRGMQAAGFNIEKFPGFGSKRQMLRGDFQQLIPNNTNEKLRAIEYWAYSTATPTRQTKSQIRIAVIGGGLAGTTTAHALAKRGFNITLFEQNDNLASAASGNPQGVLFTKLSAQDGMLNRFALTSYLFALDYYQTLLATNNELGNLCGVLQIEENAEQWQQLRTAFSEQNNWLQFVDAAQASALANCSIDKPALWFSQAGWLIPPAICQQLSAHPNISVQTQCAVESLHRKHDQWQLHTSAGEFNADYVVIANAICAKKFAPTMTLPLKAIRGQITELPQKYLHQKPATVICHDGYLTPHARGLHIGATFDLHDGDINDCALRAESHHHNLQTLHDALPTLLNETPAAIAQFELNGRVGYRCTTPDYLPLVGAVCEPVRMTETFSALAKNANAVIKCAGAFYEGLYVNVGHGSRGLTSTPLCAELIAALIAGEPRPLPRDIRQALSPARFTLRNLIRGR